MKLTNVDMMMGIVCDNNDPTNFGRVKVCIPGKWETSSMSVESLPWVYPLSMWGFQSFSKLEINSRVWVINNIESEFEYWYIPFFYLNENTLSKAGKENSDVIISRTTSNGDMQIYYNASEGIVIKNGKSQVNIRPNGAIQCMTPDASVTVANGKIQLGNSGKFEQAVHGNVLLNLINNLSDDLSKLQEAAASSPYTQHMVTPISEMTSNIQKNTENILSNIVNIG